MKVRLFVCLLAVFAFVATAADISGKWQSEFKTPDGQTRTTTYTFKVDGDTLTGTVGGARGDTPIQDGKISGDEISFVVVRKMGDNEVKMQYKGKVSGDTINFTISFGERSFETVAKRMPS